MGSDRDSLQSWYRRAMLRRIDELEALRDGVARRQRSAIDDLHAIGQALRGSGATFGFPALSAAARVVEMTSEDEAGLRLEGLIVELRKIAAPERDEGRRVHQWLAQCAGMPDEDAIETLGEVESVADAWGRVGDAMRLEEAELASAVAERFGLEVANLGQRSRAAQRLVPEAFMASASVVPLDEGSDWISVASFDPTHLETVLEITRLTGRRPRFTVAGPFAIRRVLAELGADVTPAADVVPPEGPAAADESQHPADTVPAAEPAPEAPAAPAPEAPAERAPEAPAEAAPAVPADTTPELTSEVAAGPGGALVVDDDPSTRLLLGALLEKRGFTALHAADGLEALEVMRQHDDMALAVVDLNMPRMDGLELIWELRDEPRWADLPVIVVTGERDEILETQIMEEGADDYIRKPVDPRLFLARVDAALRRAARRSKP